MTHIGKRRTLAQFTNRLGGNAYPFPEYEREWTSEQDYSVPISTPIGGEYGYDHLGTGPSPRRPGVEKVRFLIVHRTHVDDPVLGHMHIQPVDIQIESMLARLHANGHGRLWMYIDEQRHLHGTMPDLTEHIHPEQWRWSYARLSRAPDIQYGGRSRLFVPVMLEFARLSDWYSEEIGRAHV